jgi:3-oxoacyl-[acyl-carrier-protein] synthase-3
LDIDLVICGTITGDMIFPDTANTISDKVGMKNAWGFDLSAACSGFLFSLNVGRQFIETGACKKVIVLGLDVMSSIIDYTDRTTCVIFGDGGGAVLLEPVTDGTGIIDADLHADGSGRKFLHMKAGGSLKPPTLETVQNREHFVYQEGKAVFKSAIKGMVGSIDVIAKRQGLSYYDIDWLVPHQANMRIIQSVAETMNFPMEKVMVNIERYGNTTAGTLPLCLWEWENQLKKGDNLILTAFGGGFTWGALYLKWSL